MLKHETGKFRGQKVGVVLGGDSDERDVSLRTGRALAEGLKTLGYEVVVYDVPADVPRLVADRPAAVLLGLHGGSGENGSFQGFFEALNIPYSGSGVLASALAMDKARAKAVLRQYDIPTPRDLTFEHATDVDADGVAATLGWPVVAKVNDGGSSVGVFLCQNEAELHEAAQFIGARALIVEEYVKGREFTVGFFDETALGVIEVIPEQPFYDFTAKYGNAGTQYVPLEDGELKDRLIAVARRAYDVIGCRGVARVDVMVRDRELAVLELNTIPGMTETSLVPKMAHSLGVSFPEFAERMLDSATTDLKH